ncbi:MAG: hypothetical protein ABI488_08930 [Polyangiaceae bacterium]
MTAQRQSLTVAVGVADYAACSAALTQGRSALEAAFTQVGGVEHACLALLAASRRATDSALFFECSFNGSLAALLTALFALAEPELVAVFGHCAEFPKAPSAPVFTEYVSARARRASAPDASVFSDGDAMTSWRKWYTTLVARCYWRPSPTELDPAELELRRSAVGMQDWEPGAPLLHVAHVPVRSRSRVKRALRALEQDSAGLDPEVRFLWHGDRLLFFAFPSQIALIWSERVSRVALAPLTRIWSAVPAFRGRPWLRRARRSRELQRFLLDGRAPVGAWFNATVGQSA